MIEEQISAQQLSKIVARGMLEKKAEEVVILDLRDIPTAVADFFVIGSGSSNRQVEAISDSIDEVVYKETKVTPWHIEGKQNNEWVLMDFIDVVAHVFQPSVRKQFALEALWGDAKFEVIKQ